MANTQVILKEKISGLGAEADVVSVKRGFARNFLVPQGKALEATKGNLRQVDQLKQIRAKREAEELVEAEKVAGKLKRLKLKMTLSTGANGKAFGSITTIDIAKAIEEQGKVTIDRHQIQLDKPIKATGKHEVNIKVHGDLACFVKITVTAEGDTAASAEDSEES
jgi:large subunit ribosomal protein L9